MKHNFKFTIISVWAILILSYAWTGCTGSSTEKYTIDLLPASKSKDARIGLLNSKGEWVIENAFASNSNIVCTDGVITELISPKGVRYHKVENKQLSPLMEKQYATGTPFFEGYAIVTDLEGKIKILSKSGSEKDIQSIDGIQIIRAGIVSDGLIRVKSSNGKWGYITTSGEWALPPNFLVAETFTNHVARVKDSTGVVKVIDTKGNSLFSGKDNMIYTPAFSDRIGAKNSENELAGTQIVVFNGDNKSSSTFIETLYFTQSGNGIITDKVGRYGVVGKDGNILGALSTRFKYSPVELSAGYAVPDDEGIQFFDKTGKWKKTILGFENPHPFEESVIAKVKGDENRFQLLSGDGSPTGPIFYINNYYSNVGVSEFVSYKKSQSLASGWFDFDGIMGDAMSGLGAAGIHGFTSSTTVQQALNKIESINSNSINSTPVYNYDNYSTLIYGGINEASDEEDEIIEVEESDMSSDYDTLSVDYADKYKQIPNYTDYYSSAYINGIGASYSVGITFDSYLKIGQWGYELDPIFQKQEYKFLGYELNSQAKLKKVNISMSIYSADQEKFKEKLADHLTRRGWVNTGIGEFRNTSSGNRIKFDYTGFAYIFN
jgi:hypothetical protein